MDLFIVLLILHALWMLNWSIRHPQLYQQSQNCLRLRNHLFHPPQEDHRQQSHHMLVPITNEDKKKQKLPLIMKRTHNVISSSNECINRDVDWVELLNILVQKRRYIQRQKKLMILIRFVPPTRRSHCRRFTRGLDSLSNNMVNCSTDDTKIVKHLNLNNSVVQDMVISLKVRMHRNEIL